MRIYEHKKLLINLDHISAIDQIYLDGYNKIYRYTVYLNGIGKDFAEKTTDGYDALIAAWKGEPKIDDNKQDQPKKGGKKKHHS